MILKAHRLKFRIQTPKAMNMFQFCLLNRFYKNLKKQASIIYTAA